MRPLSGRRHPVADAFVFLLLGAFAVLCTLLVLMGARAYSGVVERAGHSDEKRVLLSYPLNKVRSMPGTGRVWVEPFGGADALVLAQSYEGEDYLTRIYCYEGRLRELFTLSETEFEPGDGDSLIEAEWFRPQIQEGMLTLEACGPDGQIYTAHIKRR